MSLRSRLARWFPEPGLGVVLFASVFAAYAPALGGSLLWDDDQHITRPVMEGWDGLRRIWFELGATQQYYPVLHSAFWLEHRLWGDAMLGYHLANATLHALAACLVVLVCQRLAIRGAWLAGFLFALHPVNVESVAWITEQKNTLSLVWYLLAALAWLRFDASRRPRDFALALGLFAAALATKTVTATLPCALLVVVWWKRGTISGKRDALPLLPWIAIAAAAGLTTAWVEQHVIGASGTEFELSRLQRLLVSGHVVWHDLWALAWPAGLVFTYPRWIVDAKTVAPYLYPAAIAALTVALWMLRQRSRAPLAAFLIFSGSLFPVMGFLNVYPFRYAFVADHFQYHASIALMVLFSAGVTTLLARAPTPQQQRVGQVAVLGVLCVSFVMTRRQAATYADAETLYRATIERNPGGWMARHNLGRLLSRKPGGLTDAIAQFEAVIRLKPDHARAHYALGVALQRVGRGPEAVPHFEAALRFEPDNAPLATNAEFLLGIEAMRRPGGGAEAVRHFTEADRRKPGISETARWLTAARALAARELTAHDSAGR